MTTECVDVATDTIPVVSSVSSCKHEPFIRNYEGFERVFGIEVEIPQNRFSNVVLGHMWCLAPVSAIKSTISDLCRSEMRRWLNARNNSGENGELWTEPSKIPAFREVFSALLKLEEKFYWRSGVDELVIYWDDNWFGVSCYKKHPD